jgi:hypothetical protein
MILKETWEFRGFSHVCIDAASAEHPGSQMYCRAVIDGIQSNFPDADDG